jgi:bifunctional non-homologous end joining protein LigD
MVVPGGQDDDDAALRFEALRPMLPLPQPTAPFDAEGWRYELRYRGYRLLAWVDGDDVRLRTRHGADASTWYPEVAAGLMSAARPAAANGSPAREAGARADGPHLYDGEVCVLDTEGRCDLAALQARTLLRGYRFGATPVVYCVFDLLVADGRDVRALPLAQRQQVLRDRLGGDGPPFVLPVPHVADSCGPLLDRARALGLPGVMAKRGASPYLVGLRSGDWLKFDAGVRA